MGMSVFLSAGHSNIDPGAVGGGWREADIAVEMRNMVSFYLSRAGVAHDLDGSGTVNLPLRDAAAAARKHSIAVEFHCNAGPATATGVETLQSAADTALGKSLCEAIAGALQVRNRGAKPENSGQHHRLAFVGAGGIIVELFFISNADDRKKWSERKWLAAQAVAEVLQRAAQA